MVKKKEKKPFRYLSLFSGIEAAAVAFKPLGWEPVAFAEIEPFPCEVLKHHYPDVPNLGDVTKHKDWPDDLNPDIIVGGSPCQAFSVAGLRGGLEDERGNLTLTFINICNQYRPKWVMWENVPGVCSDKTNAFGAFIAGLAGYDEALLPPDGKRWPGAGSLVGPSRGVAWATLDAKFFSVPQRRRRVFVCAYDHETFGYLGDRPNPAEDVLIPKGLCGDPPQGAEEE